MATGSGSNPVNASERKFEDVLKRRFTEDVLKKTISNTLELGNHSLKQKIHTSGTFLSDIYSLTVNIELQGVKRKLFYILKATPENDKVKEIVRIMDAFEKEARMYNDVIQRCMRLEPNLKSFASCFTYETDIYRDNEVEQEKWAFLLLEDLVMKGYRVNSNKIPGLDLDHTELTIMELAKYHGLSYVAGAIDQGWHCGDLWSNYSHIFHDKYWINPKSDFINRIDTLCKRIAIIIRMASSKNEGQRIAKLDKHFKDIHMKMQKRLSREPPEHYPSVIILGDVWTNNLLFNYDSNQKPKQVKFIDFQQATISSRCVDLSYFLYTSVPKIILDKNQEKFLKIYNQEFNRIMKKHNCRFLGNDHLSDEFLKTEFEEYRTTGIMLALIGIPAMWSHKTPNVNYYSPNVLNHVDDESVADWGLEVRKKLIELVDALPNEPPPDPPTPTDQDAAMQSALLMP